MQQVNIAKLQKERAISMIEHNISKKTSSLERELGKTITGYWIISPYQTWRFLPEKKVSLASFFCCFIQCYLHRMRLYLVVFDFQHNKWVIFNLFLIAIVVFFQIQPKSDVFPYKCNPYDVCTGLTFVLVRRLYQSDVCGFDVCGTVWLT